ncbi:hypothetical protein CRM22_009981 [Opisthorchis felineus]|uniref:CID domain-containing protein n=1 Tax=Opisthorchis felineus TaxID=147828 RepID=A0A4S2L9N0_OPIFE|nr:hypothetical protein CRM22_009981 [Opisthorchis felineus]
MAAPAPPSDLEQRNIIDKLAEFVARNGQDFESLTKEKQRENPKFAFLQGGDYYDYYKYKVEDFRKHWQDQRPYKDNYQQQQNLDYGYQWGGGRQGQSDPQWEQYGPGRDYGPRYPPAQSSWPQGSENAWYPPQAWSGGPPYQGGPGMPNMQSGYGPPPLGMGDGYRGRGYGMQPPFGYQGPPGPNAPAGYPYPADNFNDYASAGDYGGPPCDGTAGTGVDEACPELGESDIEQSEKNLQAQHEVLMSQQATEIDQLLDRVLVDSVKERGAKHGISYEQMDEIIQPLIESCTKENISKGKSWVIERGTESDELASLVLDYLLARSADQNVSFELRLHLVYLMNDVLHHCKRRGAPNHLQEAFQRVVPLLFCLAANLADDDKMTKLNRVLDLWDSNGYLPPTVLEKMRPPKLGTFLSEWKEEREKANAAGISEIKNKIEAQYASLEKQHQEFADHVRQQLATLREDVESRQQHHQRQFEPPQQPPLHQMQGGGGPGYGMWGPPGPRPIPSYEGEDDGGEPSRRMPPGGYYMPPHMEGPHSGGPGYHHSGGWPENHGGDWGRPPFHPYPPQGYGHPRMRGEPMNNRPYIEGEENDRDYGRHYDREYDNQYDNYYRYDDRMRGDNRSSGDRSYHHRSRPSRFSSASSRRESSREEPPEEHRPRQSRGPYPSGDHDTSIPEPPPEIPIDPKDLEPKCPVWELPAGLMHPLIPLCDFDYTPLDGSKMRLLPPKAPTERLLVAIDTFYLPPSHDRTRDGEGWERLGLYEFYTKKENAREMLDKLRRNNNSEERDRGSSRRSRKHSGGSSAADSVSDGESQAGSATGNDAGQLDPESEYAKPFSRDTTRGNSRPVHHLSHITAYPTAAIGQGIRTGPEALTHVPPPGMQTAFPGLKGPGITIPPPGPAPLMPAGGRVAPPGFPGPAFLQFPPPSMSQPPPDLPHGLIQRPQGGGPGYSASRVRQDARRSQSRSRSNSRSRSRSRSADSRRSRSPSRSRSRSVRSRSRSRSRASRSGSNSRSPSSSRNVDENGSGSNSVQRGSSRSTRRGRSRSRSESGSPMARFTSAPGPGGIGSGGSSLSNSSLIAARAAAMAVAASITNSLNANKNAPPNSSTPTDSNPPPRGWGGRPDGSGSRVGGSGSRFSGTPGGGAEVGGDMRPYGGGYQSGPTPGRGPGRSRFSGGPTPSRVAEMHLLGAAPDERYPQQPPPPPHRDYPR